MSSNKTKKITLNNLNSNKVGADKTKNSIKVRLDYENITV